MGLVLRQIASEGFAHDYWRWRRHKGDHDEVDGWGPTDLPLCDVCYDP